jgi:hypothetical protein
MNYEEVKKLDPTEFKRYCGVQIETFNEMVKVVKAEKMLQKKPGRPSKLSTEDQILVTLAYLREYRTFFHLSIDWGIDESNVYRTVIRIEKILMNSGLFNLPGKKELNQSTNEIEKIAVDVSEPEVERPKKKQKSYYSGKQKCHTIKSQLLIDQKSGQITNNLYSFS